jgi:hypothetical protein
MDAKQCSGGGSGSAQDVIAEIGRSFGRLMDAQRSFGTEVLGLLGGGIDALTRSGVGQLGRFAPSGRSCCDIPEPCWMPKCLGEITCRLCPGASGSVRFTITNEDLAGRTIVAMASGAGAGRVTFAPSSLSLGPKERGTVTATFTASAEAPEGHTEEALLWIRGCRDHYLRWTVTVGGDRHDGCCHAVSVSDGPDHVLHWYDHFYCPRPCFGGVRPG